MCKVGEIKRAKDWESHPCTVVVWSVPGLGFTHRSRRFHEFLQTCSENETESIFERNAPSLDQNPAFHAHIVLCGLNVVLKRFRFVWVVLKRFRLVWVVFWQIQWLDNKLPWISQFELSWALWDGCWALRFSVGSHNLSCILNQILWRRWIFRNLECLIPDEILVDSKIVFFGRRLWNSDLDWPSESQNRDWAIVALLISPTLRW